MEGYTKVGFLQVNSAQTLETREVQSVFSTSSPLRGRRQEKKERKEHELICPSLLWHYNEMVPLVSDQGGHQTFRTYFPGRSPFKAIMTSLNAIVDIIVSSTMSYNNNLLQQSSKFTTVVL